ncbi:MAG: NADH-quinone oxidoreductase subunit E [Acidimicrobiales bacterium]|nr:NADH-quinone oxidoreductase subunit E [Acidimicrobiales bacterium]
MTDLHLTTDRATQVEMAAIDAAIDACGLDAVVVNEGERLVRGGIHRANERRHGLLPALHALHNVSGWISHGGVNYIAERLGVPPAEGFGVASFYEMFRMEDPGHINDVVHVCVDAACQIAGADGVIVNLQAQGSTVHRSPCLGQCERAPATFTQGNQGRPDFVEADAVAVEGRIIPQQGQPQLRLLRRMGETNPESLDDYVAYGGFKALAEAFRLGAEGVLAELETAALKGRGGAAFPTAVKWRGVLGAGGDQKWVVVNADESEPGTFKDRHIMELDPFAIVEAATIAGFVTGARKGFIYIRGEYPLATRRLQNAIDSARAAGFLGERIAGSSLGFELEIRRGAGAYICGEETALFESLEGFRGEPRQKPPFPTTHGLFKQPTVINNPETLINALQILEHGGAAYSQIGTSGSTGTRLFCLSGHVQVPGLYEAPHGVTLGEIIELAGGAVGNLRTVLLGGAAGSFVGVDMLDLPLTFEDSRARGASLGSGVVKLFNDTTNFPAVVARIAEFFRNESCGQCVPCRIGVVRQHELVIKSAGRSMNGEREILHDIDLAMKDASICGLGHTAATAVLSAIDLGLIGA